MKKSGDNMKVSVSILKEYERLISAVKKVNESKADYLHIDVMDGKFVNNTKFPLEVVRDVKLISEKPIDLHLMVQSENTVRKYAEIMPEYLTFHVEIIEDFKLIDYIKSLGIKVGLAINPETSEELLIPFLDEIDLVLFMSVTPGEGGQTFKEEVVEKIRRIKKIAPKDLVINIDGGVNDKTIELCRYAGCDMVVSGSYVTNNEYYDDAIKELK